MRRYFLFFAASMSSLLILFGATANASSVEERLDQLNRLPDKARTEALEKEARKEGEVVWYAAMASDRAGDVIKVLGTHSGAGGDQIFELNYRLNAMSGLPVIFQTPDEQRSWENEQLVLDVGVDGAQPINFQWLKGGVPISGETNRNLILSNTLATDSAVYALVASNALGCTISEEIPVTITRLVRPSLEVRSGPGKLEGAEPWWIVVGVHGEPGIRCYPERSANLRDWERQPNIDYFQIGPDGYGSSTNIIGYGSLPPRMFFRIKVLP